ncbi:MAG TPA: hypothetical protein VIL14_05835, partial [Nitrososphaeraceae archaeon]
MFDSKTIGIVKELQSVAEGDYKNYLSDYHKIPPTKEQLRLEKKDEEEKQLPLSKRQSNGVVLAKVAIMANTEIKVQGYKKNISINFPVGIGKTVRFATVE